VSSNSFAFLCREERFILSKAAIGMGSAEFSVRAKAAANMPSAGIVLKEPTSFSAGAINVQQSLHRARVLTRQFGGGPMRKRGRVSSASLGIRPVEIDASCEAAGHRTAICRLALNILRRYSIHGIRR
jgi:hypothetical protein